MSEDWNYLQHDLQPVYVLSTLVLIKDKMELNERIRRKERGKETNVK